ncbi:MAG: hypothetical protein HQM09_03660 [Candidatus Riflebacteria bacterium]|nr:hypothetical protein [Candidatus Riflebacteria bacterium]
MRFRFVDRITRWEPYRTLDGAKTVSFEEYELKTLFGDPPELPRLLVAECLYQAAGWLAALSSKFTFIGLIEDIGRVEFISSLKPGEKLDFSVTFDDTAVSYFQDFEKNRNIKNPPLISNSKLQNENEISPDRESPQLLAFSGAGIVGQREVIRISGASVKLAPLNDFDDPNDWLVLYHEICSIHTQCYQR